MPPAISPHLYEDAYPPSPLVGLPKDPHVASWMSVLTAVPPNGERQVNHPHSLPHTTVNMLEDERVRANQAENRADFNEIRSWELQAQVDIMEREMQSLRNSLNDMTKKKDEAERDASEARKREQRLRDYRARGVGWDEGGWLEGKKNYDLAWQEGWAQGYKEGRKEERLATNKGFDARWRKCWHVAHKEGRAQGYEEWYEGGHEEGRLMGWRGCWSVAYEEGQKRGLREGHDKGQFEDVFASHEEERKQGKLKGCRRARERVLEMSNKFPKEAVRVVA